MNLPDRELAQRSMHSGSGLKNRFCTVARLLKPMPLRQNRFFNLPASLPGAACNAEYARTFAARCPCLSMNSMAESGTPHRFELIPHLNGYRLSIDKV